MSDPRHPSYDGFCTTQLFSFRLTVSGNYAYLLPYLGGLHVIDISDSHEPTDAWDFDGMSVMGDVAVDGHYVFVVGSDGLIILDASDPDEPTVIGSAPGATYSNIDVQGDYAFLGEPYEGLKVFDIGNPTEPHEIAALIVDDPFNEIVARGDHVYIANGTYGLRVIDVANPYLPAEAGVYDTPGRAHDVAIAGDFAHVADEPGGLRIIDIRDPSEMQEVAFSEHSASEVAVEGNRIYATAGWEGLFVFERVVTSGSDSGFPTPQKHVLQQNLPNPFAPSTTIQFQLHEASSVGLVVYDLEGRRVRTLIDRNLPAGLHSAVWRGLDDQGGACSSGVYFYRLEAGDHLETREMILLQ